MRILWITQRYPPIAGGMAESAGRQVASLRSRGHIVDVLLPYYREAGGVRMKEMRRDNGIDLSISHGSSIGNAIQKAWSEVQLRHRKDPYDIVIGFGCNKPGQIAGTFATWLEIPSVVLVRGNDFDRDWFEPRRFPDVHFALSQAAAVGCVTREKAEKIRKLFTGKECVWTPNSVDVSRLNALPSDDAAIAEIRDELAADGRRIIGLFGELKYKKRVPFFLQALRDAALMDRVSLLIVGRMDKELHQIVEDPVLVPHKRHLSFRSPEQLPALYTACDYVALPSLFEGFPNVLLEAMACGSVPICSTAGAMGDVIENGVHGFLFEAENRRQARAAVTAALALDGGQLTAVKQRAAELVSTQFTPTREADVLEDLFTSVVPKP